MTGRTDVSGSTAHPPARARPSGTVRLEEVRNGGKRALADALARMEAAEDAEDVVALLDAAWADPKGISLGLTGPPGVGKSTLTDALIRAWRAQDRTIGVIAVDPSSARSGGALLGDRTRLSTDPTDQGVFVRSMAAREQLGGLAQITFPAMVLMRAVYDLVIVETVGVGQSETAVSGVADLTAFCAQPGSGDALQYMKAGIMEVPDMIVVTKADMGAVASRTVADLKGALSLSDEGEVRVLGCSATTGEGLEAVLQEICTLSTDITPGSRQDRQDQAIRWVEARIRDRFGRIGWEFVHRFPVDNVGESPFGCAQYITSELNARVTAAFK